VGTADAQTERGVKAHLVIVDEAAFVDDAVKEVLIAPLMSLDVCTMVCISTENVLQPDSDDLQDAYDETGEMMSRAFRYSTVCASCANKGEKENCPHMVHRLSPWLSMRKVPLVKFLMRRNPANRDRCVSPSSSSPRRRRRRSPPTDER
jgi:hypothetical protein